MSLTVPIPAGVYSIQVVPSEVLAPGQMILFDRAVHAHPLDVIAFRYPDDVLGRLDAAMAWLLERAVRRLAHLEGAL